MSNPVDSRIQALDLIRGIAALVVVVFHYTVIFSEFYPSAKPLPFSFDYGYFGVHLFFIVSGFVILMSLETSQGRGFIRSRFIRLYPIFWLSVILTYLVLRLSPAIETSVSPLEFLTNLTMLQDYLKVPAVDGVYWSLSYELGFYFLMYCVFRGGFSHHVHLLPAVLAVLAIAFVYVERLVPHPFHYLLVFNAYGALFACGIALFLWRSRGFRWDWAIVILVTPVIQAMHDGISGGVAVSLCVGLMCWAAFFKGNLPSIARPLLYLGSISYGLYLTHQMIGYAIMAGLQEVGVGATASFFITLGFALLLASAVTHLVGRFATKPLKSLLRPKHASSPA